MAEQRWYATGRRKDATARVYLISPGTGKVTVNRREMGEYFRRKTLEMIVNQPFEVAAKVGEFDVLANVSGGLQVKPERLSMESVVRWSSTMQNSVVD